MTTKIIKVFIQHLAKLVSVQFSPEVIQIEMHFLYEEYYDFMIETFRKLVGQVILLIPDNPSSVGFFHFDRYFYIDEILEEKRSEESLLLGDSWLNLVLNCRVVNPDGSIPDVVPTDMFQKHLIKFDEIFEYSKTETFEVNSDPDFELNILLNYPIKKLVVKDQDVILNQKIKQIVFNE
jgi:hypothetical protein